MTLSWRLPVPQVLPNMGPQWRELNLSTTDASYQILHAKYLLERLLQKFVVRSAIFDIVFFQGNRRRLLSEAENVIELFLATRHLTQKTGDTTWVVCSRRLARRQLFNHLTTHLKDVAAIFCFSGPEDPKWAQYLLDRRVRFDVPSNQFICLD